MPLRRGLDELGRDDGRRPPRKPSAKPTTSSRERLTSAAPTQDHWTVFADGASRGNPGPAAIGVVVLDDRGRERRRVSRSIGRATNNEAEYRAAIAGLEAALELGARDVELCMDSELVVRQLVGDYRVRNERLYPLFAEVKRLRWRLASFRAVAIPRGSNATADRLANEALG